MNTLLNIENIGYTANNNPSRAKRNGVEYEELFPAPDWREEVVKRDADVSQTVHEMKQLIIKSAWQTKALSQRLRGNNIYNTCENIWNFLFDHFKYKEDDAGQEQLRTPALSWHLRKSRGIDCDDFSIFASTILCNLGIPHYLRIARYSGKDYFQHVYVVLPQADKQYITIDGVLDKYDTEKEPAETKDFLIMGTNNLNGINVSVLSGLEGDDFNELSGILLGVDFNHVSELEGLGQIASREEELGAIYNHLIRTRNFIQRRPHYIRQVENPDNFLGMLDYAIGYWNTDKRDEALNTLEEKENELNRLQGLDGYLDGYEDANLFYGVGGLNGAHVLGKVKAKRGFFKKVKEAAKKVGQGIKKIAKKLVKFNPISITIRGGVLLAMKTNLFKMASTIKWGYLTEEEARKNGFDISEWQNAKNQLQKIEHMFVNVLQGKPDVLKKAIITGRGGGLSGLGDLSEDLGVVATAATGGAIATAMPFIQKVLALVKKVNLQKLVAKVKPALLVLKKKRAEKGGGDEGSETPETEEQSNNSEETTNQSALPESETPTDNLVTSPVKSSSKASGGSGGGGGGSSKSSTEETGEENSSSQETENPNNLPAVQQNTLPSTTDASQSGSASRETNGEENMFTKALNWVKDNPGKSALIAGGLILALVPSARKAIGLGGTSRRGKSRKGKNKKHPPRAISGVGKRKTVAKTKKRNSRKPKITKKRSKKINRNKGGNPPQITL